MVGSRLVNARLREEGKWVVCRNIPDIRLLYLVPYAQFDDSNTRLAFRLNV